MFWIQLQGTKKTPMHPTVYDVLADIEPPPTESQQNRDLFAYPIAKTDDRIIIYELKRPQLLPPYCPCCQMAHPNPSTSATPDYLLSTKQVEPQFEYLKLPDDLQAEFELLSPELHHKINRHLVNRNGLVVEYNPVMSALLGCNTDFSFLGSESAARSASCYVLKYITKNQAEVRSLLFTKPA